MIQPFEHVINVTRSSMPPIKEYEVLLQEIWDTAWLTNMGPIHGRFEEAVKSFLEVPNVTLFTNGHFALETAVKQFDLTGEVITTPFTFASTTHAIVRNGLTPVFCDIKANNYTIDEEKIEELITPRTSAIVPVHVYGNICNANKIRDIAERHHLRVIYDAAHAFGEEYNGIPVGNLGDASMFSFHATKVFHSIEGGALTYQNADYAQKFNCLKNFGITGPETVESVGGNAKMNEFQAAMGLLNLKYISENIQKRGKIYELYAQRLSTLPGIRVNKLQPEVKPNFAYFPITVDAKQFGIDRNDLHLALQRYNVMTRKYFYPLVTDYECYREFYNNAQTPVAKEIAEQVLTLPLYSDLSLDDVSKICDIIEEIHKTGGSIR